MAVLSIALMLVAAHMATVEGGSGQDSQADEGIGENSISSADPESRRS